MSYKRIIVICSIAVSTAAFAASGTANAEWAKNTHQAVVQENLTVTVTNFGFQGELGGINCTAGDSHLTLTPGTTGHVNSFTLPANRCSTSGAIAFFGCTMTSVESTSASPWLMHNTTSVLHVEGIRLHTYLHGAFCPYAKLTLKGDLTLEPTANAGHHLTEASLSGTLQVYNGNNTAFIQNIEVGGPWHFSPKGVYGLTPTT